MNYFSPIPLSVKNGVNVVSVQKDVIIRKGDAQIPYVHVMTIHCCDVVGVLIILRVCFIKVIIDSTCFSSIPDMIRRVNHNATFDLVSNVAYERTE